MPSRLKHAKTSDRLREVVAHWLHTRLMRGRRRCSKRGDRDATPNFNAEEADRRRGETRTKEEEKEVEEEEEEVVAAENHRLGQKQSKDVPCLHVCVSHRHRDL